MRISLLALIGWRAQPKRVEKNMIAHRFSIIAFVLAVGFLTAISNAAWSAPTERGGSDKALLKAGVLVSRDLPKGWASRSVSLGSTNALQGVAGCEEQSAALALDQRRAPSRSFYDPATPEGAFTSQASNLVRVFKNSALADQFLSAYKAGTAAACLHQTNEDEFKRRNPSATIAVTDFTPVSGLDTIGDDTVGYAATITASTSEQSMMTGPLDLIYVRVGRAVLGFKFGVQSQGVPQLADIIRHPVQRVEKAQR
ncbi:MAG TPA: hypothetical protein VGO38_00260 [Acidimicrobiia bacterium]|jgi:hypothetical protein